MPLSLELLERLVEASPDIVVATDRNGGSMIVTDSGWTTCQARPFPPEPNLALPR